jgi:hypothetical protein
MVNNELLSSNLELSDEALVQCPYTHYQRSKQINTSLGEYKKIKLPLILKQEIDQVISITADQKNFIQVSSKVNNHYK